MTRSKEPPEKSCWRNMRQRVLQPTDISYPRYGGRGITICEQWSDYATFARDMGPRPKGFTLDRIDVNGNYEPSNCRWASYKTQLRNTTRNVFHTINGETKCRAEWLEIFGLCEPTYWRRVNRLGWNVTRALTTPPLPRGRKSASGFPRAQTTDSPDLRQSYRNEEVAPIKQE